jgi:DNA-binding transcriptional MocR family regulator
MNRVGFAAAFDDPAGSPIRELFPYLSRPGMISFAGGYPSPDLLDAEGLREAAAGAFAGGAGILQYGATEGDPALREQLSTLCATRGVVCQPAEILVTAGSQQAFDLLVRVFVEPGDTVFVETPAYPAAIQSLRLAGARIVPVPVDDDGLRVDVLEELLRAAGPEARPKFVYTVPTFSNPCGTLLSPARRRRLVELALEFGFLVIEDDPYSELKFDDEPIETVFAAGRAATGGAGQPGQPVIYLSSLSKTVAPALRVGWMVAPPDVLRRCAVAKQTMDLCTSPLTQRIALHYLRSGRYPASLRRACATYEERMRTLIGDLRERLGPAIDARAPRGGMFVWARVDAGIDPRALFAAAVDHQVLYVPGAAFYPERPDPHTLRLSYAAPDVAAIRAGVGRLARAVAAARTAGG